MSQRYPCSPSRSFCFSKVGSFILLITLYLLLLWLPSFPLSEGFLILNFVHQSCGFLWHSRKWRMTVCVPSTGTRVFPLKVQTNHVYELMSHGTHTTPSLPEISSCPSDNVTIMQQGPWGTWRPGLNISCQGQVRDLSSTLRTIFVFAMHVYHNTQCTGQIKCLTNQKFEGQKEILLIWSVSLETSASSFSGPLLFVILACWQKVDCGVPLLM